MQPGDECIMVRKGERRESRLHALSEGSSPELIKQAFQQLVPEYVPPQGEHDSVPPDAIRPSERASAADRVSATGDRISASAE